MFLDEWQHVFRTKGLLKIILGILLVPTFYAVIFLASLWDPYGNVKHLPVGVVNNDTTIIKSHHKYQLGKQLTTNLTKSQTADFKTVTPAQATRDLRNGRLYMVITIPKNFSQRATQLGHRDFKPITFNDHTNAGFSFIAMKMTTTTAEKVQASVNAQLTTSYLQVLSKALTGTGNQLLAADKVLTKTTAGLNHVTTSETQLATASQSLSNHEKAVATGLTQLANGSQQAITGEQLITKNDQQLQKLLTTQTTNYPQLIASITAQHQRLTQALASQNPTIAQLKLINSQLTQTINHLQTLSTSTQSAQQLLNTNTRTANQLITANTQAQAGITSLNTGTTQLRQATTTIANHETQVAQETNLVQQTNAKLATGLKAGGNQLTSTAASTPAQLKTLVAPVKLAHTDTTHVKNNGTGMTPYLMPVALFVGCITFNIIYDMFTPHRRPRNAFDWWCEKIPFFLTFAFLAASIMYGLLLWINRLTPLQPLKTWAFCVLTIWTFGSIVTFFNLVLGKTGAWLMLIFMIIQLGGSAGTYPIQLSNHFFQVIHPYLPMSISIDAFRSTLSIGNSILPETLIFGALILGFNLLMLLTFALNMSKTKQLSYDQ